MNFKLKSILKQTEHLMNISNITIRDTWNGFDGYNYDDFYKNGNLYGKKKHFNITVKEDGFADVKIGRSYKIPEFKSSAYDDYNIRIPRRLLKYKHPIIHETVHFLQHNTLEEDGQYIYYNGNNLIEYISQRTELEAHFVQLKYILIYELDSMNIDDNFKKQLDLIIDKTLSPKSIEQILFAKSIGIM